MQYKDSAYDIYEDGRCYSHKTNKFLIPQMTNKYPTYNLTLPTGKRKVYIHRMVAETFLPNTDSDKIIVNHKDGNTKNFHVDNLEWVTASENNIHASKMGLRPKGDQNAIYYTKDLDGEEWTNIPDFPNYTVSSKGRIMNKNTKRLLKPALGNYGYLQVSLNKNNKGYTNNIHLLVYYSFHLDEKKENGYVINHINGDKTCNCLDNLERVTYSDNNYHAEYIIKTHTSAKPVLQLDESYNSIKEYLSIAEAHRVTGINNIGRAIKTASKAGGFYWKFINSN